jgi:hypothetical protein
MAEPKVISFADLARVVGGNEELDSWSIPGGGVEIDWSENNQHMWSEGFSPDDVFEPGQAGDKYPGGWGMA